MQQSVKLFQVGSTPAPRTVEVDEESMKNSKLPISTNVRRWLDSRGGDYTHQVHNPEDFLRFDLTEGICWFQDKVQDWMKEMPISSVIHYPNSSRFDQQELLAEWLQIRPEHVAIGNGSDELIDILAQLFLEPGDEVVTIAPSFFRFTEASMKAGAVVRQVMLSSDSKFEWTPEAITNLLKNVRRKSVKVVWLASPNNPTGVNIPNKVLKKVISSGKIIILDKVLNGFTKELRESAKLVFNHENVIVLSGFSKTYGLPGLRLGFAISSPEISEVIRTWRLPFSSPAITLFLMERLMRSLVDQSIQIPDGDGFLQQRLWLEKEIRKIPAISLASNSKTNLLLLNSKPKIKLFEELMKRKVLATNMDDVAGISGMGLVRIAVRTQGENKKLIKVLKEIGGSV
ncbi:MAG: hypothetical protein COU66_04315 [Candidatus Pacebacteria bacterium CG10_big_fil_rev_8_21_14_0_10_44_11]|nr:MAG: hypothetical protein COU66_04315 [Candidatus Pacebacteria bacterium CG10_big_fil_rev_8_21_14_0_10_44_11]